MSLALTIKGADFSENKLTTVELENRVPCTGLTLSDSTKTIDSIGSTATITATPTPNDTTDIVVWSSSDAGIATVANGVVTAIGVGVATITATCGTHSATCEITVEAYMNSANVLERIGYMLDGAPEPDSGNGLSDWRTASDQYGGLASDTGTLYFYNLSTVFPYVFPKNTARMKITIKNGSLITAISVIQWFNSNTSAAQHDNVVKLLKKTTGITSSMETDDQGNKFIVLDIPTVADYPTIDSFVINFRSYGNTFASSMLDDVTIQFLPPAS